MTKEETSRMVAEYAAMKAKLEQLEKASNGPLTLKVSQKGAVSVYGLGRWPVTLYREQWTRLIGQTDRIKAFIEAKAGELKAKGDSPRDAVE